MPVWLQSPVHPRAYYATAEALRRLPVACDKGIGTQTDLLCDLCRCPADFPAPATVIPRIPGRLHDRHPASVSSGNPRSRAIFLPPRCTGQQNIGPYNEAALERSIFHRNLGRKGATSDAHIVSPTLKKKLALISCCANTFSGFAAHLPGVPR